MIAYLSISVPAVGTGVFSGALGLVPAGVIFAGAVVLVTLGGLTNMRRFSTASPAQSPRSS